MFDVITIDFSRFSSSFRVGEQNRGSFVVAFVMGAVAALLAGACVAPVVIQVVLFSSNLYAKGTAIALALPDKILCRSDCAGLCPMCGKNLNDEPHEHDEHEADPRWAALAELRDRL